MLDLRLTFLEYVIDMLSVSNSKNYRPIVQTTRLQIHNNIGLIGPLLYICYHGKLSPPFNNCNVVWNSPI